jgi:lysophospholipase L1-like esterase
MNSALGVAVRTLALPSLVETAKASYFDAFGVSEPNGLPMYIHALRSIERDFPAARLVLVVQPYMLEPTKPWHHELATLAGEAREALGQRWQVFDAHEHYWMRMARRESDGVHLPGGGQVELGAHLARWLAPALCL